MSRVNGSLLSEGHPGVLAGRGPTGGTNRGLVLTRRECGGSGEESGHTLSARGADLKTFVIVASSVTRLAYSKPKRCLFDRTVRLT